ncbi:pseudouridine synthase [Prochlorococcus sp. MIT 1300]|uniref:pseudouridine synthase n=1 Tax=Prochlorococcus sp. MIT 1300 TaxID=3096218 RepID=UPI002A764C34|nr:pseudouridine synthase [Prochlorococcus sp. MIT 1300]
MGEQRLQKLISASRLCSRRSAEIFILESRIKVNGQIAQIGDKADPDIDEITMDGVRVTINMKPRVVLLNKPSGIITSCHDPQGRRTVLNLLPKKVSQGLHPVGRLDFNSRGALLLTNIGDLTLQLTHPSYSHPKTYMVWVQGLPSEDSLKRWREGIDLDGKKTLKAKVILLKTYRNQSLLKVIMKEGRNRQIRRIAELLHHPVVDLQRIAISNISIEDISEGDWRELKKKEWSKLIQNNKSTKAE